MKSLLIYDINIIFIFIILIAFSVLISDALERIHKNTHSEILRKLPHILIGIIFISTPFFLHQIEIIVLSLLLVLGVGFTAYSHWFRSIFAIKRISFAILLTPFVLGVMAFLWLPENINAFIFGMLVLTFSDSFAALSGKLLAREKIPYSNKTWLGSTIFFITTLSLLFITAPKNNLFTFISISFTLTLLEIILIFGFDNLFLPIVASYLFHIFL